VFIWPLEASSCSEASKGKRVMNEYKITSSSGNVFADIGVADPEVMKLKSQLASEILRRFRESGQTQTQYAEQFGIPQSDLSDVLRGKLRKYSIERLVGFAKAVGAHGRLEASFEILEVEVRADNLMKPKLIKTETDYQEALSRIEAIFDAKPGTPEGDDLELLVTLVEYYEEKAYPIGTPARDTSL
jgi:predicted XRE-type DNA-binding protein